MRFTVKTLKGKRINLKISLRIKRKVNLLYEFLEKLQFTSVSGN